MKPKPYAGILVATKMRGHARKAYLSWCDQRGRCSNPNIPCYPYYGGKGIQVKYSSREFIGWWLTEVKKLRRTKLRLVCGRKNHKGHYEFGNIILQTQRDNAHEVGNRNELQVPVIWVYPGGQKRYPSVLTAARAAGKSSGSVVGHCKGERKQTREGGSFRYAEKRNAF